MGSCLLVETVTGRTLSELVAARDAASGVDMVELRLDGVADLDVSAALRGRRVPVIATCRPTWEGGLFEASEAERRQILTEALVSGAEYVDIEWRAGFSDLVDAYRSRVVLSSHDFSGVPKGLDAQVAAMRQTGAAVIKIAVTPSTLSETLPLRALAGEGDTVVIGMGAAGVPSRLLAARYGSKWTYAGRGAAPGQVPAVRMLTEFRFRSVGAQTALYGIVGNNVADSLSPAMHNAAFEAANFDAVYVPIAAANFADFLTWAGAVGLRGASVTIPYKLDALRASASADELARKAGAANTLRRSSDGAWQATNTDIEGFLTPLRAAFPGSLEGARAALLGAGGVARAAAIGLSAEGAQVSVHSRRTDQAAAVARDSGARVGSWPPESASWDLLVNCTPLGGAAEPDATPLPRGPFGGRLVYDLTYGADESPLLREARAAGCRTLDGIPMLVAQAERQFEWWTGRRPAAGVMLEAARRRLEAAKSVKTGD